MSFSYNRPETNFAFEFYMEQKGDFSTVFRCDSTTTQVDRSGGNVTFAFPKLDCAVTCEIGSRRECNKGLKAIVDMVGRNKHTKFTCSDETKTCIVDEVHLNIILGGKLQTNTCMIGECVKERMLRGSNSVKSRMRKEFPSWW